MRVKRKPIIYDAQPSVLGSWEVTNLFTKEKKIMSDREFRTQFEPVKEAVDAKGKPIPPQLDHEIVDNPDGTTSVRLRHIGEDL
jgi:hypothetical protein